MRSISVSGDLRLAIPVLVGWSVLASVLLLKTSNPLISSSEIAVAIGVLLLVGAFVIRWMPMVGLSLLTSGAVLLSCVLHLPTHIQTHPWDTHSDVTGVWWLSWAEILRTRFLEATSSFPSVGGQLIPGLAIGDTSRVSENLANAMKTVSLTHITAVSGANCVIVTASVMVLSGLCGAGRQLRIFCAVLALLAFVVLVTPQPSVLRAAVMALVVLAALFSGRPGSGLPLLAVATLLMLLWDPWWAIDYGFILSVSATAGLLLFSTPLTLSLSRWMPLWLATVISLPVSAQLMCQPFIILLTPQLPTYGVLANVVAAPAAPIATIVGLVACLVVWWAPGLAIPLLWMAWLPAEWVGQTATVLSRFPEANIPWLEGPVGSLVAACLSGLFFLVTLSPHTTVRRFSAATLAVSVAIWATTSLTSTLRFSAAIPTDWSIAACNVGQGDGLVLRSQGKIAVIDVGRKPEPFRHCLEQLGIQRIDLLVLTHFDQDHVGGLEAVMGKVDRAVVGQPENAEDQALLTELSRSGTRLQRGQQGLTGVLGDANWQVLWPDGKHPAMELGNPGSVTLLVAFPTYRALFLGDLGRESQTALMSSIDLPAIEVVKVAHHGSADQSAGLYELIEPKIGLFSVGSNNDYGHPRRETLNIFSGLGALMPRTDQDGLILVSASHEGLSVWTER